MKIDTLQMQMVNAQEGAMTQKAEVHKNSENGKNASVKASELNLPKTDVEKRREQAQKEAMKIVTDTFEAEQKVEEAQNEIRERVNELQDENGKMGKEIAKNNETMKQLAADWCVQEDSAEQKDLELLCKYEDIRSNLSKDTLSDEEMARVQELQNGGMTEYQKESLALHTHNNTLRVMMNDNREKMVACNKVLRDSQIEQLKSHAMVDAEKQADVVMEAASKEIVGMLMEEGMEHIEEKQEELKEAAEKQEEKAEEVEEQTDVAQERRKKLKELQDKAMLEMQATQEKVNSEVNEVLEKLKLLEEDIKGITVDILK